MISFIHSGDIHLGMKFKNASFGADKGKARREELWQSFGDMIEYAIKTRKDLVLISGDLFEDGSSTLKNIKRLKDTLGTAKNQHIVILPGNHDPVTSESPYLGDDWPDNVTILNQNGLQHVFIEKIKTSVWGIGALRNEGELKSELEKIKLVKGHKNILMLHGEFGSNGDYPLPKVEELKRLTMDYIALGHIHSPEFIHKNIAYCGSLEPLDFGETGHRGFIEGELSNEGSYRFVNFAKRNFHIIEIEITKEMTIEKIVDELMLSTGENRNCNFYRVVLTGISPLFIDMKALETRFKREVYHLELIDRSVPDIDLEKISYENRGNILGMYIDSFSDEDFDDSVKKDAFYAGIYALLEGSDLV
ncbi:metallophosphoesterase family protein [Gudongella sp. DL1XJH-153]|uniref:metallophosphoesterase family protein n=1 Tax=Gudongella sp. DL1XJH-153 TaxID=3409804 RepID=UPI003BB6C742